jgi:uncharacterized protein
MEQRRFLVQCLPLSEAVSSAMHGPCASRTTAGASKDAANKGANKGVGWSVHGQLHEPEVPARKRRPVDESANGEGLPACLACGVCCFSRMQTYVRVTGDDYERLGERAEELVWFEGNRAYMTMIEGRCAALRIDERAARFVCTVYDERPATCRDLGRGSPQCLGERADKAERPRQAKERLLALYRRPDARGTPKD